VVSEPNLQTKNPDARSRRITLSPRKSVDVDQAQSHKSVSAEDVTDVSFLTSLMVDPVEIKSEVKTRVFSFLIVYY
jgi:hypothetical protein